MSYSASRYRILPRPAPLEPPIRRFIILELEQLPIGGPAGRLAGIVTVLAPYGHAVLYRAASERCDIARLAARLA